MKLKLLSACALAALATLSQQALAADGTISFTGSIQGSTCVINAGSPNVSVTLPPVAATTLSAAGQTAGTTPFQIGLTGCSGAASAHTFFEVGTNTDLATGRLKNTGTAGNVQVSLLNDDLSQIDAAKPDGAQNSTPVSLASGSATLKYRAQYYATGAATAGTVTTTVAYTIAYN